MDPDSGAFEFFLEHYGTGWKLELGRIRVGTKTEPYGFLGQERDMRPLLQDLAALPLSAHAQLKIIDFRGNVPNKKKIKDLKIRAWIAKEKSSAEKIGGRFLKHVAGRRCRLHICIYPCVYN